MEGKTSTVLHLQGDVNWLTLNMEETNSEDIYILVTLQFAGWITQELSCTHIPMPLLPDLAICMVSARQRVDTKGWCPTIKNSRFALWRPEQWAVLMLPSERFSPQPRKSFEILRWVPPLMCLPPCPPYLCDVLHVPKSPKNIPSTFIYRNQSKTRSSEGLGLSWVIWVKCDCGCFTSRPTPFSIPLQFDLRISTEENQR